MRRMDEQATVAARERQAAGIERLNGIFRYDRQAWLDMQTGPGFPGKRARRDDGKRARAARRRNRV